MNHWSDTLLDAARKILEAREFGMLTAEEWDALAHAVAGATEPPPDERQETFTIEQGQLVRRVVPLRGAPYEHRCSRETFEAVAAAISERGREAFVLEDLRREANVTWTQAAVALAFLKERGCVVAAHGRRQVAASGFVYEDAMIEWHALEHQSARA